jgi:uncharacterized protein (DUF3084 family)
MFWTVLALAMTVTMGGIIAYYGDLIGRKYGKRRLSWFGLRPKYTAILITSISGALISTITMGVLFLLVPPIRGIILDGENAIRLTKSLTGDKERLQREVVQKQSELRPLEARLAKLIGQMETERAQLAAVHSQLVEAQKDKSLALTERDRARAMEQQAMSRYAQLVSQTTELKKQKALLTEANSQLAEANVSLHDTNADLKNTNESLIKRNATLAQENQRQSRLNAEYTQTNADLAKQSEDLTRDNSRLAKLRDELEKKRIDVAQRTKDLSDYNAQLEERNARLIESTRQLIGGYKTLREAYTASRVKRIVVHKGEDLARIVVPARSTPEQVRSHVQSLLADASQAAVSRGAAAGDQARAVQVANRLVAVGDDGGSALPVSGDERIDELVRKLAYRDSPTCIQAIAVENSVEEEPASIELIPSANREIFAKGQQVATHRINAAMPVDRLFDDVVGFLRGMGQSAVRQGMIPRMDSSGEPQVGSLTAAEIAKLVEQVRQYNGYVRIRAIAASNINAADPLALNFKVDP